MRERISKASRLFGEGFSWGLGFWISSLIFILILMLLTAIITMI